MDDVFRHSHLAGQLKGEGGTGKALLQHKEGRHRSSIELHGSVHHSGFCPGSIQLQVGVVRGDDAVGTAVVQLVQDGFGYGAAGRGLRSGPELVYEDERAGIGHGEHRLHIRKEGAVGGEVVLQGLVVPDGHHNSVKNRKFRGFRGGDEHSPLEHILKEAHRLQAHTLAAGIGTGDQEDALLRGEGDGEGHDGLFLLAKTLFQQRVAGLAKAQFSAFGQHRHPGNIVQGHVGLGHDEIQLSHKGGAGYELRHKGAQEFGKFVEDAGYLPGLGKMEFGNLVLQGHYLGRFHEGGLSGGAFVVYKALEGAFFGRCHRDEHLAVADGDAGIGIHQAFLLCLPKDGVHPAGDVDFLVLDAAANLVQLVRSRILDLSVAVQDGIYAADDLCRGADA